MTIRNIRNELYKEILLNRHQHDEVEPWMQIQALIIQDTPVFILLCRYSDFIEIFISHIIFRFMVWNRIHFGSKCLYHFIFLA